jgi:predicted transcriptional regulator
MKDKVLSMLRKKPMTDRQITTEMCVSIYYVRLTLKELLAEGVINRPHGGVYVII